MVRKSDYANTCLHACLAHKKSLDAQGLHTSCTHIHTKPKKPKKGLKAPPCPRKGKFDDQVNGNSCWQGKHVNIKTCQQVMSTITQLPLLFFYCDGTSDRPKSFTLLQAERCQPIKDWKIRIARSRTLQGLLHRLDLNACTLHLNSTYCLNCRSSDGRTLLILP